MAEWMLSSAVLIAVVLAVRALVKTRLSCRARYALWLLALVRLLVPVQLFTASWGVAEATLPERVTERTIYVLPLERADAAEQRDPYAADSFGYSKPSADGAGYVKYADKWSAADVLRAVWLAGAGVLALVLLASNLRFARRLRRVRVPYAAGVYVAEGLPSPCLVGVLRPTVYLTPECTRDERTLRHVLAHEAAHRAHGDGVWSLLRLAALCLHWYDPLVWAAAVLSKRDGELACDEAALARLGEGERAAYGETLLALVTAKFYARGLLSCSTTMAAKPMRERIETLARHPRTKTAALVLALAVLLSAAAFAFSRAEAAEAIPAETTAEPLPVAETGPLQTEAPVQTDVWSADFKDDDAAELPEPDAQPAASEPEPEPEPAPAPEGSMVVVVDLANEGDETQ